MREIFRTNGRLSECVECYEAREGQIEMAEAVAAVLSPERYASPDATARTLVVEAETGIGKTLAYLIPAVLSGRKVVVSTATLNLQDQIVHKDLPLVSKIVGQDIPAVCLKGRQNYLCLYRWHQHRSSIPQHFLPDDPLLEKIEQWLQRTATGDRAELDWLSERSGLWPKISCQSHQCLGGDCPEAAECFINGLRRQAGNARLIIVNHHLFFSDLALKKRGFGDLLPRYEAVIFDEAHHLENTATSFFSKSFSQYQLLDLLTDIERQAESDLGTEARDLYALMGGLQQRLEAFTHILPGALGRFHLDLLLDAMTKQRWIEEVELLSTGIGRLIDGLISCEAYGEAWLGLARRAKELNDNFRDIAFFFEENGHDYVYWYEKRERTIAISATPLSVAGELQDCLYKTVAACVLTSATLASGGSFSYLQERLGLAEEAEFLQFRSPFDYRQQTLLYVPEQGFPDPAAENFSARLCARVAEILQLSDGRALILCTSLKGMDALAVHLAKAVDYPLLVQGTASRNSLLKSFREQTHSILLAVASFWEGVDVVGEALSCVIIDKLPFEVPSDPVIQARIAHVKERGGNPFYEFQVPRAILALRQGVGRLMRSAFDRGVIAIMDVRLFSKGYGRTFLASLPDSPVTRQLRDLEQFYGKRARPGR